MDTKFKEMKLKQDIGILYKGSFYREYETSDPSAEEQIRDVDIINDLPFVKLKTALYFKKKYTRKKDEKDIILINSFFKKH